ncbi:hypothetical protein HDV06_003423 [Boothiomyces sp. JEL0866]|nr:hypothetical protein HDV06_003375 [Boothiomyces sp. JEL0866]KAJ3325653.1 hypothetical protein HDV06_003423 [Boothiomyces sp. JEL0866]
MTNLYGLAPATLNPSLCVLLLMYGIFLGCDFMVCSFTYGIRKSLPVNFLVCGIITVFSQFIVRGIAIYFLVTINYDCVFGRKLMYIFNYIGFLAYDYYQIKKIIQRTRPSKYEIWGFILLFIGRMATLVYCVYYMNGGIANAVTLGPFAGAGSCETKVTPTMVYVEHIYNIGMEFLMILKIFHFAYSLNNKKTNWKKIVRHVFDFEMFSFVYYFCCEIAYMIIYKTLNSSSVSFVNSCYNQVYVFLFLFNATEFSRDKIKQATKLGLKVETRYQKGRSTSDKSSAVKESVVILTIFCTDVRVLPQMTNLYGVASATLTPSLCLQLLLYSLFFGCDFLIFTFTYGIRKTLPKNFLACGLITGIAQLVTRVLVLYFIITISYDCVLGRKLIYLLNYISFLAYDYYQIQRIIERTRPTKYEVWLFWLLLLGRVGTLGYCLYYISGEVTNPVTTGIYAGAGPCATKSTATMVYVEHIYNIAMEFIMIGKIFQFAFSLNSKKSSWTKIVQYVFDFEIYSFIYYLLCEIAYMVIYKTMASSSVSLVNTFYNQIYVFLFLANATHFSGDKIAKAAKLGLKVDEYRKEKGRSTSDKSRETGKKGE